MLVRYLAAAWQQAQAHMARVNSPAATSPAATPPAATAFGAAAPVSVDAASKAITHLRKAAGAAMFLSGPVHQRLASELEGASAAKCAVSPFHASLARRTLTHASSCPNALRAPSWRRRASSWLTLR
jgi:hypothetical protein